MPDIPNFLNETTDFQRRVPPVYDPSALAMPGHILARGAEQFSAEMGEFAQRYRQARQQSDAANVVFNASKSIEDLQQKYSMMPDHQAALTGFTKDFASLRDQTLAGISDPFVKSYVTRRLDEEGIARSNEVGRASLGLEASTRRGELDMRMAHAADQAAASTDPVNTQRIIDEEIGDIKGSAAAGWIKPEEAAQHELNFRSMVQEVQVRRAINAAVDTQSSSQMHHIEMALSDPSQFPGLRAEQRERMQYQVEGLAGRYEQLAIARQNHADAQNAAALRRTQALNAAKFMAMPLDQISQVKQSTFQQMADHQLISAEGLKIAYDRQHEAIEGQTTDPIGLLKLHDDLMHGDPTAVSRAIKGVAEHRYSLKDALPIVEHEPAAMTPTQRLAFDQIGKMFPVNNDPSNLLKLDPAQRETQYQAQAAAQTYALGQFRAHPDADPFAISADTIKRFAPTAGPAPFPLPDQKYMGKISSINSLTDLQTVWTNLTAARDAQSITKAEYERQAEILAPFAYYYRYPPDRGATAPAQPKKPATAAPASSWFDDVTDWLNRQAQ